MLPNSVCVYVAYFLKAQKLLEEQKWDDNADVKVLLIRPKSCPSIAFLFLHSKFWQTQGKASQLGDLPGKARTTKQILTCQ